MSIYKDLATKVEYQKDLQILSKDIEILVLNFLDKHDGVAMLHDVQDAIAKSRSNMIETIAKSAFKQLDQSR